MSIIKKSLINIWLFWGDLDRYVELSFDLKRWLIGFGWYCGKDYIGAIHINFLCFAIVIKWR